MPSKTTKRVRRAASSKSNAPQPKDDGTRWTVVRHGRPVYRSYGGITRAEAERLRDGLREPAEIIQVNLEEAAA